MNKKEFRILAESKRSELRLRGRHGSSSDLYINESKKVAVIGIQTSEGGTGHDTIYVVTERSGNIVVRTARDVYTYHGARVWPTGISKDGRKFSYADTRFGVRTNHEKSI